MTTPAPAFRQRMAPRVNHRLFVLLDPRAPHNPQDADLPEHDEILRVSRNGVVFLSGGDLFQPTVTVEVWTEPAPTNADEQWDEIAEVEFDAPTGHLRLRSIMGGKAGPDMRITPGQVRLRAHTRGRGEAMERLGLQVGYKGVEQWLLQLWPA